MNIKFENNFGKYTKAIQDGITKSLNEFGEVAENEAVRRVPVDTGELRDSIGHTVNKNELLIGAEAEHAPVIELGSSKSKAQPFLKGSVVDNVGELKDIVDRNMP